MLQINVPLGTSSILHSNPQDKDNNAIPAPNDMAFTQGPENLLNLWGANSPDSIKLSPKSTTGSTIVTMAGTPSTGGPPKTMQVQVNVIPGPLDHFAPVADPPIPN